MDAAPGVARLVEVLGQHGYDVLAAVHRDGALRIGPVTSAADLPRGLRAELGPGTARLRDAGDGAFFDHAVGPDSWKGVLHPPRERQWRATRDGEAFEVESGPTVRPSPMALVGVRPCDLAAIAVQDRVLQDGSVPDTAYAGRRSQTVIVAAACGNPAATCFCASIGTGPALPGNGYDLGLVELIDGRHRLVVDAGSPIGEALLDELPTRPAAVADLRAADALVSRARTATGRRLDTEGIRDLLVNNPEHPRWGDVASRCLACGNCTLVCPTCFCTTTGDHTTLDGGTTERWRRWDTCFSLDFSYAAGGAVRSSVHSRYRQWLTHKLGTWWDQFGESGCVGCGRCITWCPVGIDLTEEVSAIRDEPGEPVRGAGVPVTVMPRAGGDVP
jgi:sulfhydrogenase subunit beta (sulfur reductase)